MSSASSTRAFSIAEELRWARSLGHSFQQASLCLARIASKRTKSSSHHAFSVRNVSNRRSASPDAVRRKLRAASNNNGIFCAKTRSYSTAPVPESDFVKSSLVKSIFGRSIFGGSIFARSTQPRSTSRSTLIRSGFPANAEVEEYGEFP